MSLTLKRHYPILLLLAAVISVLVFAFGGQRVVAYTTRPQPAPTAAPQGSDIGNEIALFDDGLVHTIQVILSQERQRLVANRSGRARWTGHVPTER